MPTVQVKRKQKRSNPNQVMAWLIDSPSGNLPPGYTRLVDAPEIAACINRIAGIISSTPIYLMQNTNQGDRRVHDPLSRRVDINPCPGLGTRSLWMDWIITTMLSRGDGNAYVLPKFYAGEISSLLPMPGAAARPVEPLRRHGYMVDWQSASFDPTEVLHFRLHADPDFPFKGRGIRVQADRIAKSLQTTAALKENLSNPSYKPPLAVFVKSGEDLTDPATREMYRKNFLEDAADGKPWLLPADLMQLEQIRPLSLNDLAVKDTVEMDKRSACAIFGMPAFMLGLGSFNRDAYNNFVNTVIIPLVTGIEQELTLKLLADRPDCYFKFSRRRLYDYDVATLIDIDCRMADRGYLNGDEVREDADRDPAGLTEYKVLENYIPYEDSGNQKKLTGTEPDKEDTDAA